MSKTNYVSWTKEEENKLLELKKLGLSYKEISNQLEGRTPIQIKSKYASIQNKLKEAKLRKSRNTTQNRKPWTEEEDKILLDNAHEDWAVLLELLPNRTIKSMKHRLAKMQVSRQKTVLTESDKNYILSHYLKIPVSEMQEKLGVKRSTIYGFLNKRGLKVSEFEWKANDVQLTENGFGVKISYRKEVVLDGNN